MTWLGPYVCCPNSGQLTGRLLGLASCVVVDKPHWTEMEHALCRIAMATVRRFCIYIKKEDILRGVGDEGPGGPMGGRKADAKHEGDGDFHRPETVIE